MEHSPYLQVLAGKQCLAIDLNTIIMVFSMVKLTPSIENDSKISGILNYHGHKVVVYDMSYILNGCPTEVDADTPLVLCEINKKLSALLVTQVINVTSIQKDNIQSPPFLKTKPYVIGVADTEDESAWVVDMKALIGITNGEAELNQ